MPRSRLAEVLGQVRALGERYNVWVGAVAHIGDGNLHPIIVFDAHEPGILPRVEAAHDEMIEACVAAGGTITGEHGVGLEKRKYMHLIFTPDDMERMARVRDAFNSSGLFNPGKVLPSRLWRRWPGDPRSGLRRPSARTPGSDERTSSKYASRREISRRVQTCTRPC